MEQLVEMQDIHFDEALSEFKYADEPIEGEDFCIGRFDNLVVIATKYNEKWNGRMFFEQGNTAVFVEMLSDVLEGKLREPEKSRFPYKDDGFKFKDDVDYLRVAAQTVWTNPQREPPEQVKIFNFREYKFGALGEQYGANLRMTPATARKLYGEMKQLIKTGKL